MKATGQILFITLFLTGILCGASAFAASPDLFFSAQPLVHTMNVNSSQLLKYTVTNPQHSTIHINSIDVGPHDDARYWNVTNDCHNLIVAGASCHINLFLHAPAEPGFMNTALLINYGQAKRILRSKPIQLEVSALPAVAPHAAVQPKKAVLAPATASNVHGATVSTVYTPENRYMQPKPVPGVNNNMAVNTRPTSTAYAPVWTAGPAAQPFMPFKDSPHSGIQVNLFGGGANLHTEVGDEVFPPVFPVVPPQTNTLHGSSDHFEFTGGGGVAYDFAMPAAASGNDHYVLRDISLGVNAYYVGGHDPSGQVYRFGLPQFNFDNYDIDLNSTRIMFDTEWDFHPVGQRVVPFLIGGIGDAINNMGYSESPISDTNDPGGQVSLDHHVTHNFAYEVGLGIKVLLTQNSQLSLRYLYSDLGSAEADSSVLAKPLTVSNLHTSSALLGYTYEFGN